MDYPNDLHSERIWAYLDGEMTTESRITFEKELKENDLLAKVFEKHSRLHKSLSNLDLVKAPNDLAEGVMAQIKPRVITTQASSFARIKYLGFGFGLLSLALVGAAIMEGNNTVAVGSTLQQYTALTDQLAKVSSLFSSIDWSTKVTTLGAAALLLMIYSLDEISHIARLKRAKV